MYWRIRSQKTPGAGCMGTRFVGGFRRLPFSRSDLKRYRSSTIEISRLTIPVALDYDSPEELPRLLHPNVDGVVLREGVAARKLLPQVWRNYLRPTCFFRIYARK